MSSSSTDWRLIFALCVVGVALSLTPVRIAARWRAMARDVLSPGQRLVLAAASRMPPIGFSTLNDRDSPDKARELQSRLTTVEDRNRRLQIQVATLERRLRSTEPGEGDGSVGLSQPALYVPQLVEARVLGETSAMLWRTQKLVGAGSAAGIVESSLVLGDDRLLVDQGADARVSTGDAVYAGRCVVGKIVEAGRYSSTLQLVTDAGYSGRARLARRTTTGLAFGAEGTLVGSGGEVCRLRRIHEPVNIGDEVFTGGTDGILPYAMYYGRVVRAELEPGATEWLVDVKPAASLEDLDFVQILRLSINSSRILAD